MTNPNTIFLQPDDRGRDTGIGRYARQLYRHLPDWVSTNDTTDPEVHLGPLRIGGTIRRWWRNLIKPIGDHDVVHAASINQFHRRANVLTLHDLFAYHNPDAYGAAGKLFHAFASRIPRLDAVICDSHYTANDTVKTLNVHPNKVHVVHLGVDHNTFQPKLKELDLERERAVLIVGDMNPRKRTRRIIQAVADLEDVDLWWAGPRKPWDAYQDTCLALAESRGVNLVHHGHVTDEELADLYNRACVLAYPSRAEGFGLPPLEAAACGTPTIVSTHRVFQETLGDACIRVGNWYADTVTVDEIREGIQEALNGNGPSKEWLMKVAGQYTWERCAEETATVYRNVTPT